MNPPLPSFERSANGARLVAKALTKMIIYFSDGNSRTFYSRDFKLKHTAPDRDLGITRLKRYALGNKSYIDVAKIYDNETGHEIHTFKEGYWR